MKALLFIGLSAKTFHYGIAIDRFLHHVADIAHTILQLC